MRQGPIIWLCFILAACAGLPRAGQSPSPAPPTLSIATLVAGPLHDAALVVFNRRGGFAFSDQTLTIYADGRAVLDVDSGPPAGAGEWQLPPEDLRALVILLCDPGFAALSGESNPDVACDDCYQYHLTAQTSRGTVSIQVDDADLLDSSRPPVVLQETLRLLNI
jgi:hypothetical protein